MSIRAIASLASLCLATSAGAAVVGIGDITAPVGSTQVLVPVTITGAPGEQLSAINLTFTGTINGETAQGIGLTYSLAGTIFGGDASVVFTPPEGGMLLTLLDVVQSAVGGNVAADGLLATFVLDVSALPAGTVIELAPTSEDFPTSASYRLAGGGSAPLDLTFDNGTLTVVPEPASLALLGVAAAAGVLRRR